jgi:hypothetical protein
MRHTKETCEKIRIAHLGSKNPQWKGDKATVGPVHKWVEKRKGKPMKCEHCGCTHKKRYHWANVDHKYRRNLDDYKRLCGSCHKKYDIKNNISQASKDIMQKNLEKQWTHKFGLSYKDKRNSIVII